MKIYTDGSTRGNGQENSYGGWAFVMENGYYESGAEEQTTNNRMELMAAIKALNYCAQSDWENFQKGVTICTDSAYLYNCWQQHWWHSWLRNDWTNSKKQPVLNKDLWVKLIPFFILDCVEFEKVKGHNGNHFNELADQYATTAADNLKI